MSTPQNIYESMGAEFLQPQYKISEKWQNIKAFVFDWDGVFNKGEKGKDASSNFNEVDSMGINLLRFSSFLKDQKMPYMAVISGEKNETAFFFSKREHFNASYFKFGNKVSALEHFCRQHELKPNEICFFFDDVLDLPVAKQVGLRIFIPKKATAKLTQFVKQNHLADYITGNASDSFAIREACEMLMAAGGQYEKAILLRMNYDDLYKQYIELRNNTPTNFYTLKEQVITRVEI